MSLLPMHLLDCDPTDLGDLPTWAQVLLAARAVRRSIDQLPLEVPAHERELLSAACDALDRSAAAGAVSAQDRELLHSVALARMVASAGDASRALDCAAEAALLAHEAPAAAPVGPAVRAAIASAQRVPGSSPSRCAVVLRRDFDLLRHACAEVATARHGALGSTVISRVALVHSSR